MKTDMGRQENVTSKAIPYLLLISRLVLFLAFQAIIAFLANSWEASEKYWLLTATLTNLVSIALLFLLFKREGKIFLSIFSFNRASLKKDLLFFSGLALLSLPLIFAPGYFLSLIIWGDPDVPTELMFGPIQKGLVYFLMIGFPVTIAFAELATYFGYIMPKLKKQLKIKWLAVFLPVIFLSVQHSTLPFIPDISFIIYRALVFLPFAALVGIALFYRPSLFIYFAVFHGIIDFGAALMFLFEIN